VLLGAVAQRPAGQRLGVDAQVLLRLEQQLDVLLERRVRLAALVEQDGGRAPVRLLLLRRQGPHGQVLGKRDGERLQHPGDAVLVVVRVLR
jgi:hypothetical protein